ncbi:MAG: substrate-binding domain-containing protein [Candidatus Bathyarchaeota archaeon]|nr:substrate-binding domain-containing protein [Candidatus Bathyarchaeota archaeon]
MQTWQKLIIAATLATIITIAGTAAYFQLSPKRRLIVSTTTSLYDTGLLEQLERDYENKHPDIDLNIISAGTGIAIQQAQNGDADLILVHAPAQELTFLQQGWGLNRKIIAYNYFTIVGPQTDPASIKGKTTNEALQAIVNYGGNLTDQSGQTKIWISRGDNSGTHSKEQSLWRAAGYDYSWVSAQPWYGSVGQDMGATLTLADQKDAYTLSDIGTYLKFEKGGSVSLVALLTQAQSLLNVYSVMAVNQTATANHATHDRINYADAMNFISYLVSPETQQLIENYGKDIYGQSLFFGAVQPLKDNAPQPLVGWLKSTAFFDGSECPIQYRIGYPELYAGEDKIG